MNNYFCGFCNSILIEDISPNCYRCPHVDYNINNVDQYYWIEINNNIISKFTLRFFCKNIHYTFDSRSRNNIWNPIIEDSLGNFKEIFNLNKEIWIINNIIDVEFIKNYILKINKLLLLK